MLGYRYSASLLHPSPGCQHKLLYWHAFTGRYQRPGMHWPAYMNIYGKLEINPSFFLRIESLWPYQTRHFARKTNTLYFTNELSLVQVIRDLWKSNCSRPGDVFIHQLTTPPLVLWKLVSCSASSHYPTQCLFNPHNLNKTRSFTHWAVTCLIII